MLMSNVCEKKLEYLVLFEGDAKDYKFLDEPYPMPEVPPQHRDKEIPDNVLNAISWLCRVPSHHSPTMEFMVSATDMAYGDMVDGLFDATNLDMAWMQGLCINGEEDDGALVFRLPYSTLAHLPSDVTHKVSDKVKCSYKNERRTRKP